MGEGRLVNYKTLESELADHEMHICPESLQAVLDGEIKLTHKAHLEMDEFMIGARKMFQSIKVELVQPDDIMTNKEIEDSIRVGLEKDINDA